MPKGDEHRNAARQLQRRHVGVVRRLEDDDFIPGVHQGRDGAEERLRGAGGHRDLGCRIVAPAVEPLDLVRERLAQRQDTRHRAVLVVALAHLLRHRINQAGSAVEVRKPLREVDGAGVVGERGHHGEDRDAGGRELRDQSHRLTRRARPRAGAAVSHECRSPSAARGGTPAWHRDG